MSAQLPDLDEAALACMRKVARITGISDTQFEVQRRARLQIEIREAMRAVLPAEDPRRSPDYPFNMEAARG